MMIAVAHLAVTNASTTHPSSTHWADWGVFGVASVIVLAGGLGVVTARHPVHAALFLVQTLFGVAVLFVAQSAHFLAAVQVIVYAGAIVVLFLFVIMLLGVDRAENVRAEPLRGQRPTAILLGVLGLAEFVGLLRSGRWATGALSVAGHAGGPGSNVEKLGQSLFSTYLLPFEATSALLVIAVVAAVVLARKPPPGAQPSDAPSDAQPRREPLPGEPSPGEPSPSEPSAVGGP